MDLLTELRIIALTFECIWNQEDFQKLVIDSQMLADVSLADAWQGIEAAIPHTGRKLTSTPQTANPGSAGMHLPQTNTTRRIIQQCQNHLDTTL